MVTAWRSIPSAPGPSSVSVATQTVVRTYADASVEAIHVRCMPRAEFLAKMRELIQENAQNQIYALLREMWSSMEAVVAGNELLLNVELARVQDLQHGCSMICVLWPILLNKWPNSGQSTSCARQRLVFRC